MTKPKHFSRTYQFLGEIYPQNILDIPDFVLDIDDITGYDKPIEGSVKLEINKDGARVTYKTKDDYDKDLDTLRRSLEYLCKTAIDASNFYFGTGVEMYLTLGGNTSGQCYTFPPIVNSLFHDSSRRPLQPIELTKLALRNIQLRRALEQAKDAITRPTDAGLHCYRAIEAIRRDFLEGLDDEGAAKKQSWTAMNTALKVKQKYYTLIKLHADVARHGGIKSITSSEMEEMLNKTWEILDRYIVYLDNDRTLLDDTYVSLEK